MKKVILAIIIVSAITGCNTDDIKDKIKGAVDAGAQVSECEFTLKGKFDKRDKSCVLKTGIKVKLGHSMDRFFDLANASGAMVNTLKEYCGDLETKSPQGSLQAKCFVGKDESNNEKAIVAVVHKQSRIDVDVDQISETISIINLTDKTFDVEYIQHFQPKDKNLRVDQFLSSHDKLARLPELAVDDTLVRIVEAEPETDADYDSVTIHYSWNVRLSNVGDFNNKGYEVHSSTFTPVPTKDGQIYDIPKAISKSGVRDIDVHFAPVFVKDNYQLIPKLIKTESWISQ